MNVKPVNSFQLGERLKAFTLVELLVVIAIIALLLSILSPSLNKARQSAQKIVCQSNLKQWGLGFSMYEMANRGYLPRAYPSSTEPLSGAWFHYNTMGSYLQHKSKINTNGHNIIVGGMAVCPSHLEAKRVADGRSYSFNWWLMYPSETATWTSTSVDFKRDLKRSKRLVLSDGCFDRPTWTAAIKPEYGWSQLFVGNNGDLDYYRHGGKGSRTNTRTRYSGESNVLFGDWHVSANKYKSNNPDIYVQNQ